LVLRATIPSDVGETLIVKTQAADILAPLYHKASAHPKLLDCPEVLVPAADAMVSKEDIPMANASNNIEPAAQEDTRGSFEDKHQALEASLLAERLLAMQRIDSATAKTTDEVLQLRGSFEDLVERHMDDFDSYLACPSPKTYDELTRRNAARHSLESVAQGVRETSEKMLDVHQEPAQLCQNLKCGMMENIDDALRSLHKLRAETQQLFAHQDEAVQSGQHDLAPVVELCPLIKNVCVFVNHVNNQVQDEVAERQVLYHQELDQLQEEEARYVRANDSPTRNPSFGHVRACIADKQKLLQELARSGLTQRESLKQWEGLMQKMASTCVEQPEAQELQLQVLERPTKKRRWSFW